MRPDDAEALIKIGLVLVAGLPILLLLQRTGEYFGDLCKRVSPLIGLWMLYAVAWAGGGLLALAWCLIGTAALVAWSYVWAALHRAIHDR